MREKGFYWVYLNNVWVVAAYIGDQCWKIPGQYQDMYDESFEIIKEERLPEPV